MVISPDLFLLHTGAFVRENVRKGGLPCICGMFSSGGFHGNGALVVYDPYGNCFRNADDCTGDVRQYRPKRQIAGSATFVALYNRRIMGYYVDLCWNARGRI